MGRSVWVLPCTFVCLFVCVFTYGNVAFYLKVLCNVTKPTLPLSFCYLCLSVCLSVCHYLSLPLRLYLPLREFCVRREADNFGRNPF